MARRCVVTGRGTATGNNISHSHKKTRRIWKVNIVKKRIFLEDENRYVTVKLSTRALRTLNKKGLKKAILEEGGDISSLLPKKYAGTTKKSSEKKAVPTT